MGSFVPTNVDTIKREEEKISEEFLNAPQQYNWNIGDEPLNEFDCQLLASMAFPTLFPDGKGDLTNSAVLSDTSNNTTHSFAAKLKHLIKLSVKIDGKSVYRFASHPRFAYWAYNILYRRRILAQGNFFLKQNPSEANLTIDDLKEMLHSQSYDSLMSKLVHYAKNVSRTNAYWNRAKDDLKAIITQVGRPTIFWTLACPELHWPEFHNLFSDNGETSDSEGRANVINNPHLLDWFFTERTEQFEYYRLKNTLGATWYWFRYEYAVQRGSIHFHGVAKLQSDPNLCDLSQIALQGYLAAQSLAKDQLSHEMSLPKQQEVKEGCEAEKANCDYVDFLMSTQNPCNADNWFKPQVHTCKAQFEHIKTNEWDKDYEDLLNSVQRHTQCSTAYCLLKKSNESELSFCSAVKLSFGNEKVETDNFTRLKQLAEPIVQINAYHTNPTAKQISAEDMGGLEPTVYLARKARVMLTRNLWTRMDYPARPSPTKRAKYGIPKSPTSTPLSSSTINYTGYIQDIQDVRESKSSRNLYFDISLLTAKDKTQLCATNKDCRKKIGENPGSKIVRCLHCNRAMLLKNCYIEMNINFHLEKQDQHFSVKAFPKIVRNLLQEDILQYKDDIDNLTEKLLLLENVDFELSQNNKLDISMKALASTSQEK
ncbi:hypothetical protein AWC38_SpisGene8677 [Stylophora pistillata]|uniref:Helitron helicase-like domain-containing protein n=1 Tax=Stylophora pistillata TaxID=50429 RepID=A0A2B4SDL9_STYPI|nr:hypothetical protein AWC38_SpisGene8677 [Stylophora pistillata]